MSNAIFAVVDVILAIIVEICMFVCASKDDVASTIAFGVCAIIITMMWIYNMG